MVSTDDLLGKEAKNLSRKLTAMLAEKCEKPCSEVCGDVNARMSIAIVRALSISVSVDLVYSDEQNKQPPPACSGRTKQVSASSDDSAPLTPDCQHSTAPLHKLDHDAHCLGSNSEPCELLLLLLATLLYLLVTKLALFPHC
jgi:hypothetical protein